MNRTFLCLFSASAFCLAPVVSSTTAAQLSIVPTTTLSAETSNNTSASTSFRAQTNGNAGPGNVSKLSLRDLLYPGSTTKIYATVMPWFGSPSHISVGYISSDLAQISAQISDLQSRGIQGAVIDWYGAASYDAAMPMNFMKIAESSGNFEFSIRMEGDRLADYAKQNGCDVTSEFINELTYIANTFFVSSAYTRVNGQPVVQIFDLKTYYVDWSKVRSTVPGNPMFMIRNRGAFGNGDADGGFSWVEINKSSPDDEMLSYLDGFYSAAQASSKDTIGSIYKGFNDTLASWSANRIINQRCGLTWLDTFTEANKYYSSSRQLPAIQVVTWNDYEEGTEIETGIDNCVALLPVVTGSSLNWSIGDAASESTIDHYTVFISTDGQNLMKLADAPSGTHSHDLSQYELAATTYVLYVKAIGKPSILNHMSLPAAFNPADQAPLASLSLSTTSGVVPLSVTASSAGSSDPDGNIAAVKIDFGDGAVASGSAGFSASHTYQSPGIFTVTLTVADNLGVFSSTQQTVNVAAGPGVTIKSPGSNANVKSPVHVKATGFIPGGVSYMEVFIDDAAAPVFTTTGSIVDTYLQIDAGTHTIRVVAHDTTPAANSIDSEVAFTVTTNDTPPVAVLTVEPFGGGYQVMACTARSTDADGSISGSKVDFGDGTIVSGPTAFHTYASAGTYQVTATVRDNAGLTSTATSSVTVGQAGTLAGYVTSIRTGAALTNAKLSLGGTTVSVDNTGHYSFNDVPPGAYTLAASASGYLPRSYNVSITAGATTNQNVSLSTAGVLKGAVTDNSGVGISGATVSISGGVLPSSFVATTANGGSFNFGYIPVGTYAVTVTASGYISKSASTNVNAGQTTALSVTVSSATGSISGRVASAADGHALAGATVSTGAASMTTDTNGNYTFNSLGAGGYTLTASMQGRLPASATVNVTSGSQVTQNFRLSTAGVLKGKVASASSAGIAGVKVTFSGGVFNTTKSVTTDSSGNYNAGYIPVGTYVVSVTVAGATQTSSTTVSAGAASIVNFTF